MSILMQLLNKRRGETNEFLNMFHSFIFHHLVLFQDFVVCLSYIDPLLYIYCINIFVSAPFPEKIYVFKLKMSAFIP